MATTRPYLEIYIEEGCWACKRSLELAAHVQELFPGVEVRIVGADGDGQSGNLVVATPTFILNGERVSLGNPSAAQLEAAIIAAMRGQGS